MEPKREIAARGTSLLLSAGAISLRFRPMPVQPLAERHARLVRGVAEMTKPRKRLDQPSFWKWAIMLVLGLVVLTLLRRSGAVRAAYSVGGTDAVVVVATAMALARLVLIVLLAMALARRFRDIGWPAWIGPTTLLLTTFVPSLLVAYAAAVYDEDLREWAPMVGWISVGVNLVLLIVAGSVEGKAARAQNIEAAHEFD